MANNIALFKKYLTLLDEVYQVASCTSSLDSDASMVRQGANANEFIIPKISMDGLADYSRNGGYVLGDVTLENETVKANYDRGRKFIVDAMDNEESAGVAFGRLASEFIRTRTTPELDAFRFATYAENENISKKSGVLESGDSVLAALISAMSKMDDDEVNAESRHLFITPALYNAAMNVDTTRCKDVMTSFAAVHKVPTKRFVTAIDMLSGTAGGEEKGGYKKADDGKDINFMIIEKSSVIQYSKRVVSKIVSPEENQTSDGWMFSYRTYGLAKVCENKTSGVYMHYNG